VLAVHPTQLYEVALAFLVFWYLWRIRVHRHAPGWLFGIHLALTGTARFAVEFVRAKDDRLLGPLTLAQALSLAVVLLGGWLMARWQVPQPSQR
jgi:phosphatidylglycerol:prolipoprotein diacylglycerol transferase